MNTFLNKHKAYILGVYAFFITLQFVFKDYFYPISILFYATPLILIISFGCFILWLYRKNRIVLILLIGIQLCLTYYWLDHQYAIEVIKTASAKSNSILFWNIAKNENGFPEDIILEKITSENIAILTFVETDSLNAQDYLKLKKRYKDFTFKQLQGNMLFGAKEKVESVFYKAEPYNYNFNHIVLKVDTKKTSVLIVDVYASPLHSKADALKKIITYSNTNKIDIVIGDFNTPYESIHFKNFHKTLTSFHSYGDGFTATWPYGIPLLELDQIWVNKTIIPLKLKKYNFSFSDHQLLIADYFTK